MQGGTIVELYYNGSIVCSYLCHSCSRSCSSFRGGFSTCTTGCKQAYNEHYNQYFIHYYQSQLFTIAGAIKSIFINCSIKIISARNKSKYGLLKNFPAHVKKSSAIPSVAQNAASHLYRAPATGSSRLN